MPTDVVMPQMGESIFEGTITKWLRQPGERVERDQPLFEISTDKVDAEIPAPASGVLKEIKAQAGATVQVNSVVAVIDDSGSAQSPSRNAAPAQASTSHAVPPASSSPAVPSSQPAAQTPVADASSAQAPASARPETAAAVARVGVPSGPATEVVMPQMGESIFEGTITRWLKNLGDKVTRDEPLFEISTDKVDAEIPAPASGVLSEIKVPAGQTVQVNHVVAVIAGEGAAAAAQPTPAPARPAETSIAAPEPPVPAVALSAEEAERIRSSPLVRRLAQEHGVDLRQVSGTGSAGRITKEDILAFVERAKAAPAQPAAPAPEPAPPPTAYAAAQPAPVLPVTPANRFAGVPGTHRADVGHAPPNRRAHGGFQAHQRSRAWRF